MATLASLECDTICEYCQPIADSLKDTDPGVRQYAAIGLAIVGAECDAAFDYIPNLMESLEDSDPQVRIEAVKALTEMIEAEDLEEIAETLLTSLKDRRYPMFRASAAEGLGELGEAGLPHVAALRDALNDKYPEVREAAAKALGNLGIEAMEEACVPVASLAQSDPSAAVKSASADALSQMDLGEALEHEEASYRAWAAEIITQRGTKTSVPLVDKLGELLNDEDAKVRYWCAWALGDIGEVAMPHLPTLLVAAVEDADPDARVAATKACVKLDQAASKKIAADISPSLKHEDAAFRRSAAQCLGALGADAVPEAPGLNEALTDEDVGVRVAAVHAIKNAGKQAARACGASLGECSRKDSDSEVRKWSAFILHEFGLAARYGAPARKGIV